MPSGNKPTRGSVDPDLCHHMTSLGNNELIESLYYYCLMVNCMIINDDNDINPTQMILEYHV